jgi:hypothetical protein
MGEQAEYAIQSLMRRGIPLVPKRPDPKDIEDNPEWREAIVTGFSSRDLGSSILVCRSADPRFLYVKKKKGVGTIWRKAVTYVDFKEAK